MLEIFCECTVFGSNADSFGSHIFSHVPVFVVKARSFFCQHEPRVVCVYCWMYHANTKFSLRLLLKVSRQRNISFVFIAESITPTPHLVCVFSAESIRQTPHLVCVYCWKYHANARFSLRFLLKESCQHHIWFVFTAESIMPVPHLVCVYCWKSHANTTFVLCLLLKVSCQHRICFVFTAESVMPVPHLFCVYCWKYHASTTFVLCLLLKVPWQH